MQNKQQRIAIIGAGPAGLTAAETLQELGYTNVTVFEKSDHAGGKCSSLEFEGKIYELGAGVLTENNVVPLRLARKYHVPTQIAEFGRSMTVDVVEPNRWLTLLELFIRYRRLAKRFKRVAEPGWKQIPSELTVPYTQFARAHGLKRLNVYLGLFFTGFGYSYLDTVPAAYVLKYYNWSTVLAYARKQVYSFPSGIQQLWQTVADHHQVQYNTAIQQITRDEQVTITTHRGTEQYDALIITTPLDESLHYLTAVESERDLFEKIQYVDYRTVFCQLENFPKQSGYMPVNYSAEHGGEVVFWYHRHLETNLYAFYTLAPWSQREQITDAQVVENVQRVVKRFGGRVQAVHSIARWKYFPHVRSEDLRAGFYDRLEALQGERRTFYAGEIMNFSCVGFTAEYAEALVKRFF